MAEPQMTLQEARRLIGAENGRLGGLARAKALSPRRRSEIARKAIKARWAAHRARALA
jgi:hypothetical protein